MATTITQIGKSAGCSPATVSRVLNNSGPVSSVTREAVLRHARELGYSKGGSSKRQHQSMDTRIAGRAVEVVLHWSDPVERMEVDGDGLQVGSLEPFRDQLYFTPDYSLTNSFHRELINGIIGELKRWNIKAVFQTCHNLTSSTFLKELNAPDKLGVLLLGEPSESIAKFCDGCSHPLVLVDIMHRGCADVVTIDNFGGASMAVEHLHELGHRDIGFVGWKGNPSFNERRAGFLAKMLDLGHEYHPEWFCESTVHVEEKTVEICELLSKPNRPTALVCSNDFQALSALRAAERVGLSVPKDLSIVGFDDIDLAHFTSPMLTTIRVPVAQLGRLAVRQLIISSEGLDAEKALQKQGCDTRVRTELVKRESTAKLE